VPYFVYIIQSETTGKVYTGQTSNVPRRLSQHNDPNNYLTLHTKRNKGPWKLVHVEELPTRSEAMKREKELKTGKGRELIKRFLPPGC
jgi:putative endonuclease